MNLYQFAEYIQYLSDELVKEQKEKQEEQLFQVWLHKVYDKNYPDWKKEVMKNVKNKKNNNNNNKSNEKMTREQEKENIKKAERILGR